MAVATTLRRSYHDNVRRVILLSQALYFLTWCSCRLSCNIGRKRGLLLTSITQVIEHFNNPKNVGSLNKADPRVGTGLVGAPACGDVMKLQVCSQQPPQSKAHLS